MTSQANTRISVTIPVYNGMPYIQAAVDSVLRQLALGDELVVDDNARTDGTTEYLRTLADPRISLVFRAETQDVASNWTQAIQATSGTYIKLICGDDLIEPGCLGEQSRLLDDDDRLVMVAGKRTIVDDQDAVLIASHGLNGLPDRLEGSEAIRRCLLAGTNLLGEPAAVMFRGSHVRNAMPWDDNWPYMLDLATYARVAPRGDIAFIHHPVARFRVSPASWSSQIVNDQPRDFKKWRDWQAKQMGSPLSVMDRTRANLALWARTVARRIYFKRVARRAARR